MGWLLLRIDSDLHLFLSPQWSAHSARRLSTLYQRDENKNISVLDLPPTPTIKQ
jgi:hypothetical protein